MRIVRFALATLAFCVLAMFFVAYGNNTGVNGTFDWITFGDSFEVFGGIWSFGALLLVIALLAAAFFAILTLANRNRNTAAAGVGTTLIAVALIVGTTWVRIDWDYFGGVWPVLGFIVLAAISTAIIGAILGAIPLRRRTSTVRPTTTV